MDTTDFLLTVLVVMLSVLTIILLISTIAVAVAIKRISKQLSRIIDESGDMVREIKHNVLKTGSTLGMLRLLWGFKKRFKSRK